MSKKKYVLMFLCQKKKYVLMSKKKYVLMFLCQKEICSSVLMSKKKNMLICYYVFNMFLCQKQGKEKYYEKD